MSLNLKSSGGGSVTVDVPSTASNYTATLPAANITVVGTSSAVSSAGQIPFSTDGSTFTPTAKIVSGTSVTASGTSVDFTSIPSWVKRITVMLKSVSTTGTTGVIGIRIGDSGGFATTGYEDGIANSAGTISANTTGFVGITPAAASDQISMVATIVNISGNVWVCNRQLYRNSGTTTGFINGVGNKTLTNALDRVQVYISATDSFDAGTINIMYE